MRSHVLSPLHHLRRHLDSLLSRILVAPSNPFSTSATGSKGRELSLTNPFPTTQVKGWTSLYEMVTFRPDVGYAEALRREMWQKQVVSWLALGGAGVLSAGIAFAGLWSIKVLSRR